MHRIECCANIQEGRGNEDTMDWIKNLRLPLVLVLVGVAVTILGLTGGVALGSYGLTMDEQVPRIVSFFFGITLVGLGIWLDRNTVKPEHQIIVNRPLPQTAEAVLHTLDDDVRFAFSQRTLGSRRLSIFARTAVNLLNTYQQTFVELARNGAHIRLLCVDPTSEACRTIYGGAHEIYVHNVLTTQRILVDLKRQLGNKLEVRVTRHAPTFGLTIVERASADNSSIDIQFYFLHAQTGRGRPILPVYFKDKWYSVFMDEFDALWNDASVWDLTVNLDAALTRNR